jgi:hypothetical protein
MKMFLSASLFPIMLLSACATQPPETTNLMPGLAYYEGPEVLTGKLVFLQSQKLEEHMNNATAATIYEYDLARKALQRVTDAPSGTLFTSEDGNTFCVTCCFGSFRNENITNVFIYSRSMQRARILSLDASPQDVLIVGSHVFFTVYTLDLVHDTTVTKLCDYDMTLGEKRFVELPGVSRWQNVHYDRISVPSGQTNVMYFHYVGVGKRLGDGVDYANGDYIYDIATGNIESVSKRPNNAPYLPDFRTFDGHYVFFEGGGAPIEGFELVSSPLDNFDTREDDPKGEHVKRLHSFARKMASHGEDYFLAGISPCGHYALVTFMYPIALRSSIIPGWGKTYYLVDVSTGHTRVFLTDEVESKTEGCISQIRWVR